MFLGVVAVDLLSSSRLVVLCISWVVADAWHELVVLF